MAAEALGPWRGWWLSLCLASVGKAGFVGTDVVLGCHVGTSTWMRLVPEAHGGGSRDVKDVHPQIV